MAEVNSGIEMGEMSKLLDALGHMGRVMKQSDFDRVAETVS